MAFRKSGSLGIQVSGGNKTGIFVAAVKEGSPAYNEGLRKGDQVLMVSTLLNQWTWYFTLDFDDQFEILRVFKLNLVSYTF